MEGQPAYIQQHSEKNLSYWLGLTKFADLTNEEFRRQCTGTRVNRSRRATRKTGFWYADSEVPDAVDWREKGAVTSVKDQGSCGMLVNRLLIPELVVDSVLVVNFGRFVNFLSS